MDWQPIETAPKDGAFVDLWVVHRDYAGRFSDCLWSGGEKYGGWVGGSAMVVYPGDGGRITHWMPKPEPPKP